MIAVYENISFDMICIGAGLVSVVGLAWWWRRLGD
jgi:hypothetical protein